MEGEEQRKYVISRGGENEKDSKRRKEVKNKKERRGMKKEENKREVSRGQRRNDAHYKVKTLKKKNM